MDGALVTASTASVLRQFIAVRVELNSGSEINLIDGRGVVTFPVDGSNVTFTGSDPIYGSLATASSIEERVADQAPRFTFTIYPPNETALGSLMQPSQQGSRVRVWWGLVSEDTGAVIGTEAIWSGRFDTCKANAGPNQLGAEIDTVSAFDRMFVAEEGARLNGVWHKSIWPNETGLDYVYNAQQSIYWGSEAPAKPAVSSGTSGGASGNYASEY
jgi:hypothetical protein